LLSDTQCGHARNGAIGIQDCRTGEADHGDLPGLGLGHRAQELGLDLGRKDRFGTANFGRQNLSQIEEVARDQL